MTARRSSGQMAALVAGMSLYTAGSFLSAGHADVTSSGLNTSVNQSAAGVFDISGGTRPNNGSNLFHSFGDFSLDPAQSAVFVNDSGLTTKNILSRVTGGNPSEIFGTIDTSDFPGANLFLMNPAGILFGPTAQLNVDGSFHATTADYIKLGNTGDTFYADPAQASVLSVAEPSAFGFLTPQPAAIDVNTSSVPIVQVAPEQTFSFVGGPINIGAPDGSAPGYVMAPAGRMNVVSVASAGEATFDGTGFNVDAFPQLGNIDIRGGSIIDARDVFIRGGNLVIDEAVIVPGAFSLFGLGPPPDGGEVNVKVAGNVAISGTAPESFTQAPPGILTFNGAFDSIAPPAKVPDIRIEAGSVSLSGFASVQTDRYGPGDAPSVDVSADTVTVENGAGIALFNFFEGSGGNLTVSGRQIELSGGGVPGGAVGATGLLAQGLFHPSYFVSSVEPALSFADSGTIKVTATGKLDVSGGAQITTDSRTFGRSDDISIEAGDISLSDKGKISAQSLFAGNSGNVTFTASGNMQIRDGFVVAANTFGSGDSGNVDVTAGGSLTISGVASGIATQTTPPPQAELDAFASLILGPGATFADLAGELGLAADADLFAVLGALNDQGLTAIPDLTPGAGGNILVKTPSLTASGRDSAVDSSTAWDGDAGRVQLDVGSLDVTDGAQIRSRSGLVNLDTGEFTIGAGNAGAVNVAARDTISISGMNSTISTTTFGAGRGGDIALTGKQVDIHAGGSVTSETSSAGNAGIVNITATDPGTLTVSDPGSRVSTTTTGDGAGGRIELTGRNIQILNGGSVTADSSGTGLAGDITIAAGNKVNLNGGTISTRAVTSDGGNIVLTAPEWVYLLNSDITTSVESGFGGGGNITIDPQFVILNQSNILANAYGGPGGNIAIVADNLISTTQSRIDASSALGINGTVNISSPDQDVAQELAVLPENFLDVSGLISDRCGARAGASSLVSAGPGGLAVDPDGYLPSFGTTNNAVYNGTGKSSVFNSGKPSWALAVDSSGLQLAQVTCTR
jgi:filamentous hemagglutinin family protein